MSLSLVAFLALVLAAPVMAAPVMGAPIMAEPSMAKSTAKPKHEAGIELEQFAQHINQSPDLKTLLEWITTTDDNQGYPYIIVDKVHAQLFIFDGNGKFAGTTPVLLGKTLGDIISAHAQHLSLTELITTERITPAGRFTMEFGHDLRGEDILWIDYASAISLHRTYTGDPKEQRNRRLRSKTPADNRISYGCINVSKSFYEKTILRVLSHTAGYAYIMPEITALVLPLR